MLQYYWNGKYVLKFIDIRFMEFIILIGFIGLVLTGEIFRMGGK